MRQAAAVFGVHGGSKGVDIKGLTMYPNGKGFMGF